MYDTVTATSADGFSAHAQPLGGQDPVREPPIAFYPPNRPSIADRALQDTLLELQGHGLSLSSSMTTGLQAVAEALEAMSEDRLPPRVHLSSLDPGVGKTTLLRHFICALLASPDHEDVAVLVCLSLHEEVEKMRASLEALGVEVGLLTGRDEVNDKASTPPGEARVLLTTQAKLRAVACHHARYSDMQGFHFLDQPRQVRIWDESLMPGEEVRLSSDDLSGLLGHLRRPAPDLCSAFEALRDDLNKSVSGDVLHVPDLEEMGGAEGLGQINRLLQSDEVSSLDRLRLERLKRLSGQPLPVHRNNLGEVSLLDYHETMLPDLAPLLVLDASGRCRRTYDLWAHQTGSLVRLAGAVKDYAALQIHLWKQGSSKASHLRDKDEVILRGVTEAILTRPTEDWLIVIHKDLAPGFRDRLLLQLEDRLSGALHFLTWGKHHGTNAFAEVPNVVLASLLFLPPETYETRVRLCAGMDRTTAVPEEEVHAMAVGELLHDLLQALCRATVRGMDADGRCPPCRAWIISASQMRLQEHLPQLFPGCRVLDWTPRGGARLPRRIRKALEVIDAGFGDAFSWNELADEIGVDRKDFRKKIATAPSFLEEISNRGYVEAETEHQTAKGPRLAKGARRDCTFPVDPDAWFTVVDPG